MLFTVVFSLMNADEKAIINYLKGWPNTFVSAKEIARKVGGKERYEDDRGWALSILTQMVRIGILETDHFGYYKLKVEEKKERKKTHVAPQILKILKSSGKSFGTFVLEEDEEDLQILKYRPVPKPSDENIKKAE